MAQANSVWDTPSKYQTGFEPITPVSSSGEAYDFNPDRVFSISDLIEETMPTVCSSPPDSFLPNSMSPQTCFSEDIFQSDIQQGKVSQPESNVNCNTIQENLLPNLQQQPYDNDIISTEWSPSQISTTHSPLPENLENIQKLAAEPNIRKRKRTHFNAHQLAELEKEFRINKYVSKQKKTYLSQTLNLPEKQIKIWYQNKRMKIKKENPTREDTPVEKPSFNNWNHPPQPILNYPMVVPYSAYSQNMTSPSLQSYFQRVYSGFQPFHQKYNADLQGFCVLTPEQSPNDCYYNIGQDGVYRH